MSTRSMSGHQRPLRGATDVWLTPPEIVNDLGPFDLDPCAATGRPWDTASEHLTEADDGLAQNWTGLVWMNPPFSEQEQWFHRLAAHGNGIGLCAARTETRWFVGQIIWEKADAPPVPLRQAALPPHRRDARPSEQRRTYRPGRLRISRRSPAADQHARWPSGRTPQAATRPDLPQTRRRPAMRVLHLGRRTAGG